LSKDIPTIIPHADFGAPDCCGHLYGRIAGDQGVIACNECRAIFGRVPACELQLTLDCFDLLLEIVPAICRCCRSVNLVPGFSRVGAFVCQTCGKANSGFLSRDVPEEIKTIIPHAEFGAPECRGFLTGKPGDDLSEISCNECGAVLAYIVPEDLRRVLAEMELRLEVASVLCLHCGSVNLIPDLSRDTVLVCQTCGKGND
jgi:hypothetical protein